MLEKIFKLEENKTNFQTEFIAGLTTFMAMSYIIFVNPTVLSQTGMDYNAVYGATILASIIGTLVLGLYANVPYAQSAGIGLGSLFTYTICGSMGYTWQEALAMVFICAVINLMITLTSIRKKIITSIPTHLQEAITVGIGLFITYIGLMNAELIEFQAESVKNGFAQGVIPQIASFGKPEVLLAIVGLLLTIILLVMKVKGAYLISIVATTLLGIPGGVTQLPSFANYTILPSLSPTLLKLDIVGLFTAKTSIIIVIMTIFTLCISDLFDSIGIFIGTGKKAGIFKITKDNKLPKKLEKALIADSIGTVFGSLLGTSNVTTIAIPAFFTVILMPLSYSITTGIEIGFILFTLINYITGNKKEVSPVMAILTILFIINFVYTAL